MKRWTELKQRAALAWRILRARDGNLAVHADRELQAAGYYDGDEMNALMAGGVIDLVRVFSAQGHSGFSAPFALGLFGKVAGFAPLGPLTGADSEWHDVSDASGVPMWQNRRCHHIFKGVDGRAYDLDAVIFEEPNGGRFTGLHSRQFITFPYTPKSVIAQVPEDATDAQQEMLARQALAAA